ncbi:MAG: MurR/RpiR family transcriptional regulator [Bryobacteraceae bacterium]|nr:MurR/RpiR family transcriptional regulator [Bryobacteraceae bacterium]
MERKVKNPHGKPEMPVTGGSETDRLSAQLAALEAELPPAVLRVAHYLNRNRVAVLANSAAELAAMIGTSDATVVRTVQALGFQGLGELRQSIATSLGGDSAPLHHMHQTLEELTGKAEEAATTAADLVIDTHAESLLQLQKAEARAQVHAAIAKLHPVERIVIYAAGPSKPLAEYLEILLGRHGQPAKVIGQSGLSLADDLLDLSERDGLLMLSYGKPYREVLLAAAEAGKIGIPIVLVTDAPNTKLARTASAVIAARRGRAERVALHGTTLIALEALVMGLAVANRSQTMRTLARLGSLRAALGRE